MALKNNTNLNALFTQKLAHCFNCRVIFDMGLADTRVTAKNGKTLVVLTAEVQRLASSYDKFKREMLSDES
jgi:hypothetical protein